MYVVSLDLKGKMISSEELLEEWFLTEKHTEEQHTKT
jgi:hypothetical protein